MASEAEKEGMDVGVALPLKVISKVDPEILQKSFSHNMSSYEAHAVMSAGPLKILKELPDGRLLVQIEFKYRCRMEAITQSLPYYKAKVVVLDEIEPDVSNARHLVLDMLDLSGQILKKPIKVDGENISNLMVCKTLQTIFNWVLGWLPLEVSDRQSLLEIDSLELRSHSLVELLKSHVVQNNDSSAMVRPNVETKGNIIFIDFNPSGNQPSLDS